MDKEEGGNVQDGRGAGWKRMSLEGVWVGRDISTTQF